MRWLLVLSLLALGAAGWASWHYVQFRRCGERFCPPSTDVPAIRLPSGREVAILGTRQDERRQLVVDYLTAHDRNDVAALCEEARAVWESVSEELDSRRVERATLGPTSPDSEFLGMSYLLVPLYTCCVPTYLRVVKERSGSWQLPDCPR